MVVKDILEELRHYSPNTKVFLRNSDYPNAKDVLAEIVLCKEYPEKVRINGVTRTALVIAGSTSIVPYSKDNTKEEDGRIFGEEYRLCYIEEGVMYFTDDFDNCWGDDWKSAPLQDDAGAPYSYNNELSKEENSKRGYSHLVYIGFRTDWKVSFPWLNANYSVRDVNKGEVAWVCHDEAGALHGGATLPDAVGWLTRAGLFWGRLEK